MDMKIKVMEYALNVGRISLLITPSFSDQEMHPLTLNLTDRLTIFFFAVMQIQERGIGCGLGFGFKLVQMSFRAQLILK